MSAPAKPTTPAPAAKATDAKPSKEKKARKPSNIPEDESSEAKFRRIAAPRIQKAVTAMKRLETIGRSPAYTFSTEQANRVMKYLDDAVEAVRAAFVARVNRKVEQQITL